jgi:DNA-binding SARP family transcriptional activator
VRALLAYLILHHDQAISRDMLSGHFWAERSDAEARRALSRTLWKTRKFLDQGAGRLFTRGDWMTFRFHPGDWLDVAEFERSLETPSPQCLGQAVRLYRGDFLEGVYDDWVLAERARLHGLYLHALEGLFAHHKQQSSYERALAFAQRLVAADPLHERAHRELMRLYHVLGRAHAALQQYATIRQLLDEELGVAPARATTALYHEIVAALEQPQPPHLLIPLPSPPALRDIEHLPFVGRDAERTLLVDAIQAAMRGSGQIALLEGEAGVGKTRLVEEIAADARWRGMLVATGAAQSDAGASYQPLVDLLTPLLSPLHVSQLALMVAPERLSAVSGVLPAVAANLPDLPAPPVLDAQRQRQQMWEGLAHCLSRLAAITPLTLILEDVHWADEATLALLPYLAPHLRESRLLLLCTCRSGEARQRPAVWKALATLDRNVPLLRLHLPPFDALETLALVGRALDDSTNAASFAQRLWSETGGNALFLVETLKALLEAGVLARAEDGTWRFPAPDCSWPSLLSIHTTIGDRLSRLTPAELALLEWAAVLGKGSDFSALAQIGLQAESLLPVLAGLVGRGFLAETETGYRFTHDLVREAVYQTLETQRRRRLHLQAGTILETLHPEQVEQLAHHFTQAGVWRKAAAYQGQAGDQARAAYAGEVAIVHYDQALAACEMLAGDDHELVMRLYQARGETCQITGHLEDAEQDFRAARHLAIDIGHKQAHAKACNSLSYLSFQRGDHSAALDLSGCATALAAEANDSAQMAHALLHSANALRNMGRTAESIDFYRRAIVLLEALGDQVYLADALNRMGYAHVFAARLDDAEESMLRGLAIRRRLNDKVGLSFSLSNLAGLYAHRGDFQRSREAAQEAYDIAQASGDPYGQDAALEALAEAQLELGLLAAALPNFKQAVAIAREIGDSPIVHYGLTEMGLLYLRMGDPATARSLLLEALENYAKGGEVWYLCRTHEFIAKASLALAQWDEASEHARTALATASAAAMSCRQGTAHRVMAKVLAGKAGAAQAELRRHFETSIELLRAGGFQAALARSLAAYGCYLLSLRKHGARQGADMVRQAHAFFVERGMTWDVDQLQATGLCDSLPRQIVLSLPAAAAPTGRPLREDEWVQVSWTVVAAEDEDYHGKVARRRHRLLRLLRQAAQQGAAPTVAALAESLGISTRTLKRDLAAMRGAGHAIRTRGSREERAT